MYIKYVSATIQFSLLLYTIVMIGKNNRIHFFFVRFDDWVKEASKKDMIG